MIQRLSNAEPFSAYDIKIRELFNAFASNNYGQAEKLIQECQKTPSLWALVSEHLLLNISILTDRNFKAPELILKHGGSYSNGFDLAKLALAYNKFECVKLLIVKGLDINSIHPQSGKSLLWGFIDLGNLHNMDDWRSAVQFMLNRNIDIHVTHPYSKQSYLHAMVDRSQLDLVKQLISMRADVNAKDKAENTPVQLLNEYDNPIEVAILETLFYAGATIPEVLRKNLYCMKITQPKVRCIEHYNEDKGTFITTSQQTYPHNKLAEEKDVVILVFGKYEPSPTSEFYGAIKQYYNMSYYNIKAYDRFAKDFTVFRVLLDDSDDILLMIRAIKEKLLKPSQQIQHLMIVAHGSNSAMALSKGSRLTIGSDSKTLMTKISAELGPEATIALAGCLTANNSETCLSREMSEVTEGRVVSGAPSLTSQFHSYTITTDNGKKVPFGFFSDKGVDYHVGAYKNGSEIAYSKWVPTYRARL